MVDVSHQIVDGMTTFPGLPAPQVGDHLSFDDSRATYAPGTEFHIGRIAMVANTGTYIDSPAHRFRDGSDIADLALERVADLPGIVVDAPEDAIGADVFAGVPIEGRAVLLRTGWDRTWRTDGYAAPGHPYLTEDAAKLLADGGAAMVGIDSVSVDDISPRSGGARPVHTVLLAAGIPVVEHLCLLSELPTSGFRFFAAPVKVRGLGTFPVRAFAVVDDGA